uniref:Uncharacterized protein n=1 Tax=Salarias fasciatus TaxID=181472 RepID=A0A672FY97_SALFA
VLEVQVFGFLQGDEELRVVGVTPLIGHRQDAGARVPHVEVFILKLAAVDGLASCAVALGDVSTLRHQRERLWYDPVEDGVPQPEALLSGTQSPEVLCRLGYNVGEELDSDAAAASFTRSCILSLHWLI